MDHKSGDHGFPLSSIFLAYFRDFWDYITSIIMSLRISSSDFWTQVSPGAMQQILSAVAYCHRQFVLHGDLKPENVLIGGTRPDGTPLCIVCDFGHATVCLGSELVAAPGDPRYIAPEVIAKEHLCTRSDVYMLGVTAFELLTGGWLPFFNLKAASLSHVLSTTESRLCAWTNSVGEGLGLARSRALAGVMQTPGTRSSAWNDGSSSPRSARSSRSTSNFLASRCTWTLQECIWCYAKGRCQ